MEVYKELRKEKLKYIHIHTQTMGTKTISITEEAYRILQSKKEKEESFSKVIVRLSGKKNLASFFGALSEKSAKDLKKEVELARKRHKKRHLKRIKEQ